jgi:DnaJ-class molecular chaperone
LAALGGDILVPTVDGEKQLKVPAGTQAGATVVMRDAGVPRLNNPTRRGDQIVHLIVQTPAKLSSEEKKLLEKLAELRGESLHLSKEALEAKYIEPKSVAFKESLEAAQKPKKAEEKVATNAEGSGQSQGQEEAKDEHSIFEKIGEFFKPKNGEQDNK